MKKRNGNGMLQNVIADDDDAAAIALARAAAVVTGVKAIWDLHFVAAATIRCPALALALLCCRRQFAGGTCCIVFAGDNHFDAICDHHTEQRVRGLRGSLPCLFLILTTSLIQ